MCLQKNNLVVRKTCFFSASRHLLTHPPILDLPKSVFFELTLQFLEAYSEPCEASEEERFAKIVTGFEPLTIFAKRSMLDV